MSYKPADFFLGVVDLFGVLLPGVIFAALLAEYRDVAFDGLGVTEPHGLMWVVVAYLVVGYVLGHLLRALGEILDRYVYDRFYVPAFKRPPQPRISSRVAHVAKVAYGAFPGRSPSDHGPDPLLEAAEELADHDDPKGVRRNTYSWAETYVQLRSSAASAEIARFTADSKFFRSLAIVSLVAGGMSLWRGALALPALMAVVAFLSLHQFTRLRWKGTTALYQAFIQLRHDPKLGDQAHQLPYAE